MSDKKSKKSSKLPLKHLLLGIPTNIAAGPLGFRAELDIKPKGEQGCCPCSRAGRADLTAIQMRKTLSLHGSRSAKEKAAFKGLLCQGPQPVSQSSISNQGTTIQVSTPSTIESSTVFMKPSVLYPLGITSHRRQEAGGLGVASLGTCRNNSVVCISSRLAAPDKDRRNRVLGITIPSDTANEPASGFLSLKNLLGNISNASANRQVRPRSPTRNLHPANPLHRKLSLSKIRSKCYSQVLVH